MGSAGNRPESVVLPGVPLFAGPSVARNIAGRPAVISAVALPEYAGFFRVRGAVQAGGGKLGGAGACDRNRITGQMSGSASILSDIRIWYRFGRDFDFDPEGPGDV